MTASEKQLISNLRSQKIGLTEFEEKLPVDIFDDEAYQAYVYTKVKEAINKENEEELQLAIYLLWMSHYQDAADQYIDFFNQLLIVPFHNSHQEVAFRLQKLKHPSSIPFIRKVLESNFDYLAYTCSESRVIAKWLSWILAEIGTRESIGLMEEYTHSADEGIRKGMLYRLEKIEKRKDTIG